MLRVAAPSKHYMAQSLTRVFYLIVRRVLRSQKPTYGLHLLKVLMARPDGKFAQNQAGINSMLFYHATIIIHGTNLSLSLDLLLSDNRRYLPHEPQRSEYK